MKNSEVFSLQAKKLSVSISNNILQSDPILSFNLLRCLAPSPHACRRERTSLDLGVPAVTSLLMPVWGPGLVSHAGRGDRAAALRPLHCAVHGSGCVSPCISSTALAPFSSAELRQWGVIAHVPPPHFFNEHSSHQLGCQGE